MVEAYGDLVKAGDFNELKGIVRELAMAQHELAAAQQRTEQRLKELAQAQHRTELRLEELTTAQQELTNQVQELVTWQRGEAGRREGERYEQLLAKRAFALLNGGQGGPTNQLGIQQWLQETLRSLPGGVMLEDEENPFLADLIWWKRVGIDPVNRWRGEQYVVVEASLRVNGKDVLRAARRAATLQQARVQATGLVVGDTWVGEEPRQQAEKRGVVWKVGNDLSEGFLAFCRLPG